MANIALNFSICIISSLDENELTLTKKKNPTICAVQDFKYSPHIYVIINNITQKQWMGKPNQLQTDKAHTHILFNIESGWQIAIVTVVVFVCVCVFFFGAMSKPFNGGTCAILEQQEWNSERKKENVLWTRQRKEIRKKNRLNDHR